MESRSLFYLIARLLNVLLTVLDNNTLIVLIHLYTKEIIDFAVSYIRSYNILHICPAIREYINHHITSVTSIVFALWIELHNEIVSIICSRPTPVDMVIVHSIYNFVSIKNKRVSTHSGCGATSVYHWVSLLMLFANRIDPIIQNQTLRIRCISRIKMLNIRTKSKMILKRLHGS